MDQQKRNIIKEHFRFLIVLDSWTLDATGATEGERRALFIRHEITL